MEWSAIYTLIDSSLYAVVAACWIIGYILKQTPRIPDWSIVYFVTIAAVLLCIWLQGWRPESIIQGILCGAFAVFGHQIIKQTKEAIRQS